jgi:transposase
LSLDEFSQHKGQGRYVTTVVDLDHPSLLEVIDSHQQDDLIATLSALYPVAERMAVEEVSIDMWASYTTVVRTVFPQATIVYDRFHVMQHVNREINHLRKQMKVKFKGAPHLLWKHHQDLDDDQRARLHQGLKEHPCLAMAYELKEELFTLYETARSVSGARRQLRRWLRMARLLYVDSAAMIERHLEGICQYFANHTTSGITEGINTRIKLIKRQGYGFPCFPHFRLRLLACLGRS